MQNNLFSLITLNSVFPSFLLAVIYLFFFLIKKTINNEETLVHVMNLRSLLASRAHYLFSRCFPVSPTKEAQQELEKFNNFFFNSERKERKFSYTFKHKHLTLLRLG